MANPIKTYRTSCVNPMTYLEHTVKRETRLNKEVMYINTYIDYNIRWVDSMERCAHRLDRCTLVVEALKMYSDAYALTT